MGRLPNVQRKLKKLDMSLDSHRGIKLEQLKSMYLLQFGDAYKRKIFCVY